jgi:hypothetical protein
MLEDETATTRHSTTIMRMLEHFGSSKIVLMCSFPDTYVEIKLKWSMRPRNLFQCRRGSVLE